MGMAPYRSQIDMPDGYAAGRDGCPASTQIEGD